MDKKQVSRAQLERLLEFMAIEALTPENARADLDEIMASAGGSSELDAQVERAWNRLRGLLQASVGACVACYRESEGLSRDTLADELGSSRETIEKLAARKDPIERSTIASVTFSLATQLELDYGRLVRCLSRGLAVWHARRDPNRRPLLLKAARSDTASKKKGDPDAGEVARKPPHRG